MGLYAIPFSLIMTLQVEVTITMSRRSMPFPAPNVSRGSVVTPTLLPG